MDETIRVVASTIAFIAMALQIRLIVRHYSVIEVWVRRILVPYTVILGLGVIGIVDHLRNGSELSWATAALAPVFAWLALALALAKPGRHVAR